MKDQVVEVAGDVGKRQLRFGPRDLPLVGSARIVRVLGFHILCAVTMVARGPLAHGLRGRAAVGRVWQHLVVQYDDGTPTVPGLSASVRWSTRGTLGPGGSFTFLR